MRKLWVSISGGRTSAYMAIELWLNYSDRFDLKFIYANTGLEHEETLLFLDRIDRKYKLNIVWLEAVINPEVQKGTKHKIIDFKSASRNGEPFEAMIEKYGIPNQSYPHCTRELKIQPMESYIKDIGWEKEFRAIGIRIDEMNRCRDDAAEAKILYPLIDFFQMDKIDILDWFEDKDWDLNLHDYKGNCVTCWKKSDPKIFRIIRDEPERMTFFDDMEVKHGLSGHNEDGTKRVFFRGNRTAKDMIATCNSMPEFDFNHDRCANEECGIE